MREQATQWHALPLKEVFDLLKTTPDGLSVQEAEHRLLVYGPNELPKGKPVSPLLTFIHQFRSPIIYVLLFAAVLSIASDHVLDGFIIFAVLLLNAIIGFFQEYRAERTLEALRDLAAPQATALRSGEEERVSARELVPGDVVLLESGDKIPADGRIFLAVNLTVDESALTGESVPVEKQVEPVPRDTPLAERTNMVYSGTIVTSGRGMMVVTATGKLTELGRIASEVAEETRAPTPVQRKLARLAGYLGISGLVIAVSIIGAGFIRGLPWFQMFLLGVAAAVSFIPEGLPAAITVVLAVGVQRMARSSAVVRKLPAVETLGSATVICSDKTGTLTRNEMTVREGYTSTGTRFTVTGEGYAPFGDFYVHGAVVKRTQVPDVELLFTAFVLCNNARVYHEESGQWRLVGDPTEGALVVAGDKLGLKKHELEAAQPRIFELPFESEKRYMVTLHDLPNGGKVVYVKGAPERVLAMCGWYQSGGEVHPLSVEKASEFSALNAEMAANALRVLAAAYKYLPAEQEEIEHSDVEQDMVFLGAVGMMDPPRDEARLAIQAAKTAGIRVIMVTGDHPDTARTIAELLGLLEEGGRVVDGRTLDKMTDDQLSALIGQIAVFARAEPEHKVRIIRALKSQGHIVAMTGDGVNDAPALKLADIGIAMGITGTDVAKEAADMVLLDDNFATIVRAVEEGRSIFANIRRVVTYLLSTNIGEVFIHLTTILSGLPIPLLPVQILWINLVTDGFSTVPLSLEPKDPTVLQEPPRDPREPVVNRTMVVRIGSAALLMLIGTLLLYTWGLQNYPETNRARTYAFVVMVFFQIFNVFNVRSFRYSLFRIGALSNPYVVVGAAGSVLSQIVAIHTSFFQKVFNVAPLTLAEWVLCGAVASSIFWFEEMRKLATSRTSKGTLHSATTN
jgi:Ca2+-transporting ATPase